MSQRIFSLLFLLLSFSPAFSQNRLYDHNTIDWITFSTTLPFNSKTELWMELQSKRADFTNEVQQNLGRFGINLHVTNNLDVLVGLGRAETFAFGDYPTISTKSIPEIRFFEQVVIKNKINRVELQNRIRLEQRYGGKMSITDPKKVDTWTYTNRLRNLLRANIPLKGKTIDEHEPYLSFMEEVLISFGKNVGLNFFDQNRAGAVLGYKFNKALKAEVGLIFQTVIQSKFVESKPVIQYNVGPQMSVSYALVRKALKK